MAVFCLNEVLHLSQFCPDNDRSDVGSAFRNWADEMETWYSPFETDESGWHGGDLNIPTPFPASWKTDLMNTNFQE